MYVYRLNLRLSMLRLAASFDRSVMAIELGQLLRLCRDRTIAGADRRQVCEILETSS
jgi:hypothetical protein